LRRWPGPELNLGVIDFSEGRLETRFNEAAYPGPVPVLVDPPSPVVDPSSPAPETTLLPTLLLL